MSSRRSPPRGAALARALFVAAGALLVLAAPAAARQPVFDPALRRLLEPEARQELQALTRPVPGVAQPEVPLADGFALHRDAAGRLIVGLLVELAAPEAVASLQALGAEVGTVVDDVATVRIPLDLAPRLEELPLARVHAARTFRAVHDSSMRAIRATEVRARAAGGWTGRTGRGVIIGIIDSGVDLRHPDFIDDAGSTRVLAAWDQTLGLTPPPGYTYGFHCPRSAIQNLVASGQSGVCPLRDFVGHGTHVAGTAAGDGSGSAPLYNQAGVAPEADLLVVKAGDGSFSEDRVVDALSWVRREAQALGRPAVVNLSFGHQFGPHDGTSLFDRVIDDMVGPGFIVVAAAGNSGANLTAGEPGPRRLMHARVIPAPATERVVEFQIETYTPSAARCTGNVLALSAWYHAADRLRITVVRPNGSFAQSSSGPGRVEHQDPQGRVLFDNVTPAPSSAATGETYIQIDGCGTSGVPAPGRWQVMLRAEAPATSGMPADLYLHTVMLGSAGVAYGTAGFDNRFNIGSPGAARGVITVGAFTTRNCWTTGSGSSCYDFQEPTGEIARFSAAGPTRDGRLKPEITAPGIAIVSALSREASAPTTRRAPGGLYWALEGTSMAAPHVTGTIALLLQARPTLTPDDVRQVLAETAVADAFTTHVYDVLGGTGAARDWWGYGKLDAAAALGRLLAGTVTVIRISPRTDTLPQGAVRQLVSTARDDAGSPVFAPVQWLSLTPAVASVDFAGRVRALQPGTALIVAAAGFAEDTVRLVVEPPAVTTVTGRAATGEAPLLTRRDEVLPLLALRLSARGPEAVQLRTLAFSLAGDDEAATAILYDDPDGDGSADPDARVLGSVRLAVRPGARTVVINVDSLVIPANGERTVMFAVVVSGRTPHGSTFTARLLPDRTRTLNLRSGAEDRVAHPAVIATGDVATTLLAPGELLALSENPVRGRSVIMNFAEAPTAATIHTASGARVLDALPRIGGASRWTWDLTNDRGVTVAPGVYLLVLRIGDRVVRERILVLTRAGGGP